MNTEDLKNAAKLLPCPFCGGEPSGLEHGDSYWWIECESCEIVMDDISKKTLMSAWNHRA